MRDLRTVTHRGSSTRLLAAFAVSALLYGCGSSKVAAHSGSGASAKASTSPAAQPASAAAVQPASTATESVASAAAACEQAVETAPQLPASAKPELRFVCHRNTNGVVYEDRRNDRVVCGEVANATPLRDDSAKKRSFSACYEKATRHRSH